MGLFDFLKRKPAESPGEDGPSPDYAFAHYALRHVALSDPLQFLAIMASPDAQRFVDAVLQDVAEQCGRECSFDAASIKIHRRRVNTFPCVVIEFPEPNEMAEAHMVALVVAIDTSCEQRPDVDEIRARYFTLEKGFSLSNKPRTVLAEWDTQAHSNYGDGPVPTVDAFVSALGRLVSPDS